MCVCVSLLVIDEALLRELEKRETRAGDLAIAAQLWRDRGTSLRKPVQSTYWLDWVLLRPTLNGTITNGEPTQVSSQTGCSVCLP